MGKSRAIGLSSQRSYETEWRCYGRNRENPSRFAALTALRTGSSGSWKPGLPETGSFASRVDTSLYRRMRPLSALARNAWACGARSNRSTRTPCLTSSSTSGRRETLPIVSTPWADSRISLRNIPITFRESLTQNTNIARWHFAHQCESLRSVVSGWNRGRKRPSTAANNDGLSR